VRHAYENKHHYLHKDDILFSVDVINNPVAIELSPQKNRDRRVLRFTGNIRGEIIFVEAVEPHYGWLSLITCYRRKKARQGPTDACNTHPEAYVRNGLPTTYVSSISQPSKSVNDIIFPASMSVSEIISYIPRGRVGGITVSGGEPFEQQPEELRDLLAEARLMGLDTLVYSGYTYEELRRASKSVLREIDILIDGPYMRNVPRAGPWAGSGNQRALCLREGEVVLWDTACGACSPEAEIHIAKNGRVTVTGSFRILLKNGRRKK
jgi:hypothetical protein